MVAGLSMSVNQIIAKYMKTLSRTKIQICLSTKLENGSGQGWGTKLNFLHFAILCSEQHGES
jgi:hypothetical protein